MEIKIEELTPEQTREMPAEFQFGRTFSNRMFTQQYDPQNGWHNATIGPYGPISLDPATAVFHYSQEIFEGLKAYKRPDGHINLFRPWENAARFNRSAERMSMPSVDVEDHVQAMAKLVELEQDWIPSGDGTSLYIRPAMIATDPFLGVSASKTYLHYIIVGPVGNYYEGGMAPVGVLISEEYRRAARGGTGAAKTGGNYSASLIASEQAKKQGYTQVLWLDAVHGKYIEEVGTMNIMFVYEGKKVVTPRLSGSILPGITRDSLLTLAADLGYEVAEDDIDVEQMLADVQSGKITEVFGCGTAVVISPVGWFGFRGQNYDVSGRQMGPVAQRLYDTLTDIQFGRGEDPYGWTMKIEAGNGAEG